MRDLPFREDGTIDINEMMRRELERMVNQIMDWQADELCDEGATSRADLTARLGKSSSHVSTYKKRLLEAGVIEEPQRGTFTFALPGFAEYVRAR